MTNLDLIILLRSKPRGVWLSVKPDTYALIRENLALLRMVGIDCTGSECGGMVRIEQDLRNSQKKD